MVNIVFGYGWTAGQALVVHPRVQLISFTGGTATAAVIRKSAAHLNKKFSLEVGLSLEVIFRLEACFSLELGLSLEVGFSLEAGLSLEVV